jgi:hypothetical protein
MPEQTVTFDPKSLSNPPDAERLVFGLRDTGYDFYTASADIIDNSIAAGATVVNIQVELMQDGRKFVYFGDNGCGMAPDQLVDAMRYGAPRRKNSKSLGKFGLGLKTASTSCCKKFAVISRSDPSQPLAKLAWDIEKINNDWMMLPEEISQIEAKKFEHLCGDKGTLVVWSKCDRILNKQYDEPGGVKERTALKHRVKILHDHIGKIFHKYLDPEERNYPSVKITLDGESVLFWNPFYPEKSEQMISERESRLQIVSEDGTEATAFMRAWILPHRNDITRDENDRFAKISNKAQGFYVYREGRMVHNGGWLDVFGSVEPHFSLLRVEFCFDHELDDAFQIDVRRSRIIFDPALEEALSDRLSPIRTEANNRYRRKSARAAGAVRLDHAAANNSIAETPIGDKPSVESANFTNQEASIQTTAGQRITIKTTVRNNLPPTDLYVTEADDVEDGFLWEPSLQSSGLDGHVTAVRLNKRHDFYKKIYVRLAKNGQGLQGLDLMLWALSNAEYNNTDEELTDVFKEFREQVSRSLKKLLDKMPLPDSYDLDEAAGHNPAVE